MTFNAGSWQGKPRIHSLPWAYTHGSARNAIAASLVLLEGSETRAAKVGSAHVVQVRIRPKENGPLSGAVTPGPLAINRSQLYD